MTSGTGKPRDEVVNTRSVSDPGPNSTITLVLADGSPSREDSRRDRTDEEDAPTFNREEFEQELDRFADSLADLFG